MSAMFDYITGRASGPEAELKASLEHALGCLGTELEEAEKYRAEIERLRLALEMGLQLGESGKHGDGKNCPTCHFVREARAALGRAR